MGKYALAFLSIMITLPLGVYSQDSTALLHKLADKTRLSEEEKKALHRVLEDPEVKVNEPKECLTPLCRALYRGNTQVVAELARHGEIDLTLPSTIFWGKRQLLPPPIESAAEDPDVRNTLEGAVSIQKLLRAALSIPPSKRSKRLQNQIECWRQTLAFQACIKALGEKIPKEVIHLLQKTSPPAPAD